MSDFVFRIAAALAGVAAALAVPTLPLRVSVWGAALLVALAACRRCIGHTVRTGLAVYAWFWMSGCVVAAKQGALLLAMSAALAAILVSALAGFIARRGATTFNRDLFCRVTTLCLILPVMVLAATLGGWGAALAKAKQNEAAGAFEKALGWAQAEESRARRIEVRLAVAHALHRQAELHLRLGRRDRWRKALAAAVSFDPRDHESLTALLRDSLDRSLPDDTLRYFALLPDKRIARDDARRVLPVSQQARDWQAFSRAWKLAGRPRGEHLFPLTPAPAMAHEGGQTKRPAPSLADAGKALYFLGDMEAARALLEDALAADPTDRTLVRMLCIVHVRSRHPARAAALLKSHGHRDGEYAYLRSLLEGGRTDPNAMTFEDTLQLRHCALDQPAAPPGGQLLLTFSWRLLAPLNPEWRVFVHIRKRAFEGYRFQGDHTFTDVGVDPESWPLGADITYTIRIDAPPDAPEGDYQAVVGVWDGHANLRPVGGSSRHGPLRLLRGNRVSTLERIRLSARNGDQNP